MVDGEGGGAVAASPDHSSDQSGKFLILYALAAAGGAVAYMPLLTILLPVRISLLAGDQDVAWLSYVAFAGAIAASIANIAFGWLSDLTKNRRAWIFAGLIVSSGLLVAMGSVEQLTHLIALVICWQLGLNMMLAPLAAWAGDCVPDHQKGFLGGLLAFSPALGALAGSFVTIPDMASADMRLVIVALIVAAMVLPVLMLNPKPMPHLVKPTDKESSEPATYFRSRAVVLGMWTSRLLVQIAEAALFVFLFFWFRSINPQFRDSDAALILSVALCIAVPAALWIGRWSDTAGRPILPLAVSVGVSAIGLAIMAVAQTLPAAIFGYLIFGISATIFLALHTSQTLRVLPRPQNRGRDLGVFNLTNTVPSLIMPGLTLALVPGFGFSGLFVLLAVLAASACTILITISRRVV